MGRLGNKGHAHKRLWARTGFGTLFVAWMVNVKNKNNYNYAKR